jgi:hypothetical protein
MTPLLELARGLAVAVLELRMPAAPVEQRSIVEQPIAEEKRIGEAPRIAEQPFAGERSFEGAQL